MSLFITEECINCGACDDTCPTNAIGEDTRRSIRVIDSERCTECVGFYERTMCQVECPVECCIPDPQNVETQEELILKAQNLFPEHEIHLPPVAPQGRRSVG